jgi:D-aspartate ligase
MTTDTQNLQTVRPPPVLLTMPAYGGTIAAARYLGKQGIKVVVAGDQPLSAARFSKYTSSFIRCPSVKEEARFIEWLVAFGKRRPGHVLLSTSDETALLFAQYAEQLKPLFHVYQPTVDVIKRVLDKKSLSDACRRAGLELLPSWFPADQDELLRLAPTLTYPILIKSRTQVHRIGPKKGAVVRGANELVPTYNKVAAPNAHQSFDSMNDAERPMLQRFEEKASESVLSVTGFITKDGHIATRGARKVFQRTRPMGIGVCFEAAHLNGALQSSVKRLCQALEYFGVFEVEFLNLETSPVVIDFNPRFYHQMGLDIVRGLPLPMWAYLCALGKESTVQSKIQEAKTDPDTDTTGFCDRFTFWAIITAMTVTGRMKKIDAARWKTWYRDRRGTVADIAMDSDDPWPGVAHAFSELTLGVKSMLRFR